jgi:hypothetical protein
MKEWRKYGNSPPKTSLALMIALAISVLGGLAFLGILIRVGPF